MSAAARRLAAAITAAATHAASIPWRSLTAETLDRFSITAKTLIGVHLVNHYICGAAIVIGPSMMPTFNITGDVVAVDRVSTRLNRIEVGDVVLLRSPENPVRTVAKRVVGMEGDRVRFKVDPKNGDEERVVEVPKGYVWVQGDNIYDSRDSRTFGAVPYGLLHGRIFFRIWPLDAFGLIGQNCNCA